MKPIQERLKIRGATLLHLSIKKPDIIGCTKKDKPY